MVKHAPSLIIVAALCFAGAARAGDVAVDQRNMRFSQDEVVLKAGDTLVVTNHDPMNHNVQVVDADGEAEDKGLQRPGEIVRYTFSKPGTYQVHCQIHPDMILLVTVK